MDPTAILLLGVTAYPFAAALSVRAWPALRARLVPTGFSDRRAAAMLFTAHTAVFAGCLVSLLAGSWSQPDYLLTLGVGALAGTFGGVGWRLDAFRLLWLAGLVPLLVVVVPFVNRQVYGSLSGRRALRTTAWMLVLLGLLVQITLMEGIVASAVVWTLVPVAVRALVGFPQTGRNGELRAMLKSLLVQLLAAAPLVCALLWVRYRAHSATVGAAREALASSTTLAATWVGILILTAVVGRVTAMTAGAETRRLFAESLAWRTAVEVLLPWADLALVLRYVVGLLPVTALRVLCEAQIALGAVVCGGVALALAATHGQRRPLASLHVPALWGVVLVLTAGKSSVAWAGASAYLFNYCLLAPLAHTTPLPAADRRVNALLFAVTLAGATALPHSPAGQMLFRVGQDLLQSHGAWAPVLLGLGVLVLAATHLVSAGREQAVPARLPLVLSWSLALATGLLLPGALRQWLSNAFAVFGLTPRW